AVQLLEVNPEIAQNS
nr:RecName: Full=Scolopendra 10564.33 Da toxin [Scolopendra viridicornis nigra]